MGGSYNGDRRKKICSEPLQVSVLRGAHSNYDPRGRTARASAGLDEET